MPYMATDPEDFPTFESAWVAVAAVDTSLLDEFEEDLWATQVRTFIDRYTNPPITRPILNKSDLKTNPTVTQIRPLHKFINKSSGVALCTALALCQSSTAWRKMAPPCERLS
jgi:hypothetical protein